MKHTKTHLFLPNRSIKRFKLNKEQVHEVRHHFSKVALSIDALFSVFIILIMIFYFIRPLFFGGDYWNGIAPSGPSFVGKLVMLSSSILLQIYMQFVQWGKIENHLLTRIILIFYPLAIATGLQLFMISDAMLGMLGVTETISAGILWIAVICFCPLSYFVDQIIITSLVGLSVIITPCIVTNFYPILEIHQYILIAIVYMVASFIFHNIFFYVECQQYYIEHENERLLDMSNHDPLTFCLNRNGLQSLLKFKEGQKVIQPIVVIVLDIDNFKQYNDNYSHLEGDKVLRHVTQTIRDTQKGKYQLIRWGGDEFVIIKNVKNRQEAAQTCEEIRKCIENTSFSKKMKITISVGGSFREEGELIDFNKFFQQADSSLYNAKNHGKNKSCLDGEMIKPTNSRKNARLKNA